MVKLKLVEVRSLADIVFDQLVDRIARGELEPGATLCETDIARDLGMSRGPLREAIRRLEGRKLVVRFPNVGPKIVSHDVDDISEIYLIRERVEGLAARLAAERMSARDIEGLASIVARHEADVSLARGFGCRHWIADEEFHAAIARGSGSEKLVGLLAGEQHHHIRIYLFHALRKGLKLRPSFTEHKVILDAIRSRDPELADLRTRHHFAAERQLLIARSSEMSIAS